MPEVDVGSTVIRLLGKSVGHCAFALSAQSRGVGIIKVVDNASAGLIDELPKHFFDGSQIGIEIEVFFLNVENEGVLGMKATQRAIAFVAFGNEIFAPGIPMRVRSENWNFSAHIVGRMQSAFTKHMYRHSGGGRFPMHSGDHNPALRLHNRSEGFGAAEHRFSATVRS